MTEPALPEIISIQPGDTVIVHLGPATVSLDDVLRVKASVTESLKLQDGHPVMVLGRHAGDDGALAGQHH